MSNSAKQLGGKCPYMPYLGRGQMSGGNMSYTRVGSVVKYIYRKFITVSIILLRCPRF